MDKTGGCMCVVEFTFLIIIEIKKISVSISNFYMEFNYFFTIKKS